MSQTVFQRGILAILKTENHQGTRVTLLFLLLLNCRYHLTCCRIRVVLVVGAAVVVEAIFDKSANNF